MQPRTDSFIDATTSHTLEPVPADQTKMQSSSIPVDPAKKVIVALANEMQKVYADEPQKLAAANSALRKAVRK